MTDRRQDPSPRTRRETATGRDARLKTALRANIARRKARVQAQGADDAPGDTPADPPPVLSKED